MNALGVSIPRPNYQEDDFSTASASATGLNAYRSHAGRSFLTIVSLVMALSGCSQRKSGADDTRAMDLAAQDDAPLPENYQHIFYDLGKGINSLDDARAALWSLFTADSSREAIKEGELLDLGHIVKQLKKDPECLKRIEAARDFLENEINPTWSVQNGLFKRTSAQLTAALQALTNIETDDTTPLGRVLSDAWVGLDRARTEISRTLKELHPGERLYEFFCETSEHDLLITEALDRFVKDSTSETGNWFCNHPEETRLLRYRFQSYIEMLNRYAQDPFLAAYAGPTFLANRQQAQDWLRLIEYASELEPQGIPTKGQNNIP